MRSHHHTSASLFAIGLTAALLAGCSGPPPATTPSPADEPHGYVEGAEELTEARLSLVAGDADRELALLDLVTETSVELLKPTRADATTLTGNGRFLFRVAETANATTVDVVDSGV
jgi:hypothetical protein